MNDNDRENLQFLLDAGEAILKEWYEKVDEDDRLYASALLTCYSWELLDEVKDCTLACSYLSKYRQS